jgi:probable HAF family extracellular repeat protein
MVDLGTLGGTHSVALAVNNWGLVVGGSDTGTTEHHATMWLNVPSAADALTDRLSSSPLERGLANALTNKLRNAVTQWQRGNSAAAANQVRALIAQINAHRGKTLSDAQVEAIVDIAAPLAFALSNGVSQ